MEKFIFRNHPTDLKMQAFGKTEADLLSNAALGMMYFLYPKYFNIKESERKEKISVKAENIQNLLVQWLSEILELSNINDTCYNIFDISQADDTSIKATIFGKRIRSRENIKAVTYHELSVEHIGGRWKATVRFNLKK